MNLKAVVAKLALGDFPPNLGAVDKSKNEVAFSAFPDWFEEYAWPIVRAAIREEIEKVLSGAGPR